MAMTFWENAVYNKFIGKAQAITKDRGKNFSERELLKNGRLLEDMVREVREDYGYSNQFKDSHFLGGGMGSIIAALINAGFSIGRKLDEVKWIPKAEYLKNYGSDCTAGANNTCRYEIYDYFIQHPPLLATAISLPLIIIGGMFLWNRWADFCSDSITVQNIRAILQHKYGSRGMAEAYKVETG